MNTGFMQYEMRAELLRYMKESHQAVCDIHLSFIDKLKVGIPLPKSTLAELMADKIFAAVEEKAILTHDSGVRLLLSRYMDSENPYYVGYCYSVERRDVAGNRLEVRDFEICEEDQAIEYLQELGVL